jgi:chitin synthase
MMSDPRLIGLSGNVKIDTSISKPYNFWVGYQLFEYLYGQVLTRAAQGVFGKVTCLPGCIQIFSADPALLDIPLNKFKEVPDEKSVFFNIVAFLGEDRRFTCLCLYENPEYRTGIVFDAYGITAVPDSFSVFFSQRRRWFLSAQANNCIDFMSADLPLMIRLIAGAQILASAITPFIFLAILFAVLRVYWSSTHRYFMLILGTSTLVWVFKFIMILICSENIIDLFYLIYGFVCHTLFGVFVQTYNILHALSTMDDLEWGLTRRVKEEDLPILQINYD